MFNKPPRESGPSPDETPGSSEAPKQGAEGGLGHRIANVIGKVSMLGKGFSFNFGNGMVINSEGGSHIVSTNEAGHTSVISEGPTRVYGNPDNVSVMDDEVTFIPDKYGVRQAFDRPRESPANPSEQPNPRPEQENQ